MHDNEFNAFVAKASNWDIQLMANVAQRIDTNCLNGQRVQVALAEHISFI